LTLDRDDPLRQRGIAGEANDAPRVGHSSQELVEQSIVARDPIGAGRDEDADLSRLGERDHL